MEATLECACETLIKLQREMKIDQMNLQVADVHKALLSLSRCADMGFESRFGRLAGALIDEETEEVIPLQRKGNLYVLKCWLRALPFGRPEAR